MKFALIGAAGYVAPRHMEAIYHVGGDLVAVLDPHDSVGVLDKYFPSARYFNEFERFDRYLSKAPPNYVVVASPNYLHDSHIRFGLRLGSSVICEKPVVLHERNLDELLRFEGKYGGRVWCIQQARLHADVRKYRALHRDAGSHKHVQVHYSAPRGQWYRYSWKGNPEKSGGMAFNIGIHLFDLGAHLFGWHKEVKVWEKADGYMLGTVYFTGAHMDFTLSTHYLDLDNDGYRWTGVATRTFKIGDVVLDLSTGFDNLHNQSYELIVNRFGYGLEEAREGIRIAEAIRGKGDYR
jgi:UDP-N-acetyl-2-amino-2-deoxyglucuronate dehydrogenase